MLSARQRRQAASAAHDPDARDSCIMQHSISIKPEKASNLSLVKN